MILLQVITKAGGRIYFRHDGTWESFLLPLMLNRCITCPGYLVPYDSIDSITPAPPEINVDQAVMMSTQGSA